MKPVERSIIVAISRIITFKFNISTSLYVEVLKSEGRRLINIDVDQKRAVKTVPPLVASHHLESD